VRRLLENADAVNRQTLLQRDLANVLATLDGRLGAMRSTNAKDKPLDGQQPDVAIEVYSSRYYYYANRKHKL
jgi:hypothetical protein